MRFWNKKYFPLIIGLFGLVLYLSKNPSPRGHMDFSSFPDKDAAVSPASTNTPILPNDRQNHQNEKNSGQQESPHGKRDLQNHSPIKTLEALRAEFGGDWRVLNGPTSTDPIKSLLYGPATAPLLNPETGLHFLNRIRPLLGVPDAELEFNPHGNTDVVLDYQQKLKGLYVYGGRARIVLNSATSTPTTIKNNLKAIEFIRDDMQITEAALPDLIRLKITNHRALTALHILPQQVYHVSSSGHADLSWVVTVRWEIDKTQQAKELVISAVDGTILYERDLASH